MVAGYVATAVGRRILSLSIRAFAVAAALVVSTGASAQLVITSTTETNYAYAYVPSASEVGGSGDINNLFFGAPEEPSVPGQVTNISINTQSTVNNGDFFFLQNDYCIGYCSVAAQTKTYVTITNNGGDGMDVRLDSLITPGHLAFQGDPSLIETTGARNTTAGFVFSVTQDDSTLLYQAQGSANGSSFAIITSDGSTFNGLNSYQTATQAVYDWSATNLNLELGWLAAGASTTVVYNTFTTLQSNSICTVQALCDGAQVAFGDPRNSGQISNDSLLAARSGSFQLNDDPQTLSPVIGRQFSASNLGIAAVESGSDLPPDPAVLPPVSYQSPAAPVPEPAAWIMLIAGFGLTGGAMRRRAQRTDARAHANY